MALWGKRDEELPPELRGKTPEQIAAALAAAEAAVGKVPALEARLQERETELGTFKTTVEQLQASIAALDARTTPTSTPQTSTDPTPNWGVDADAAFRDRIMKTGIVSETMKNTATLNRIESERRITSDPFNAAVFKKYQTEIDDWWNRCSPQEKTIPGCFENVFNLIMGRHMREINEAAKDPGFLGTAGGAPSTGTPTGEPAGGSTQLTETQKLVARRFGISEEDYLKQLNKSRTGPLMPKVA